MLSSAASSPNSHCREDGDLGDRLAVCSVETRRETGSDHCEISLLKGDLTTSAALWGAHASRNTMG